MNDLLTEFFIDSGSHIDAIEASLLKLEKDPANFETIDDIFRAVHSIKGNAGMLGMGDIQGVGEQFEAFLEAVREKREATSEEIDIMFKGFDGLKASIFKAKENNENGEEGNKKTTKSAEEPDKEKQTNNGTAVDEKDPLEEAVVVPEEDITFLTFNLDGEKYGIEIVKVREIILLEKITPVPNAKVFVAGVMNLRDQVIPIFCLRERLNIASNGKTYEERNIIIVEVEKTVTGVKVDEVTGIVNVKRSNISQSEQFYGGVPSDCFYGIGRTEEGTIILLDVKELCDPEEMLY